MSTKVLEGYTLVVHNGQNFLVLDFAVDDLEQKLAAMAKRQELGAEEMAQTPREALTSVRSAWVGEGLVRAVQEPELSQREWLALHAEVKALQQQFGYKDAGHRLYLAEIARLKESDKSHKALVAIRQKIDKTLDHEILLPMSRLLELDE